MSKDKEFQSTIRFFSKTECHKIPVREKKGAMISGLRVSDVWFFVRVFLPDCVGTKMKMLNTIFSASLLSSGQQVFAVVLAQCFCGFPPI